MPTLPLWIKSLQPSLDSNLPPRPGGLFFIMRRFIPLVLLVSCSGTSTQPPVPPSSTKAIAVILQESRQIALIDPETGALWSSIPTGQGNIPNHLIQQGDTLMVINSGGFTGSASVSLISLSQSQLIDEIPFPSWSNPLEGILIDSLLVMSDFGKSYSEHLTVLNLNSGGVDTVPLAPRPINISHGILATANGMDENYNYPYPSKVFLLDGNLQKVDSAVLQSGMGGLDMAGDYIMVVSSGIPGQTGSILYRLTFPQLEKVDSLPIEDNIYSIAFSNDGTGLLGNFFGKLYLVDTGMRILDTIRVGSTLNCIAEDGGTFYVSINGYSGSSPNYLLIVNGNSVDSIQISPSDKGIYCAFPVSIP